MRALSKGVALSGKCLPKAIITGGRKEKEAAREGGRYKYKVSRILKSVTKKKENRKTSPGGLPGNQ